MWRMSASSLLGPPLFPRFTPEPGSFTWNEDNWGRASNLQFFKVQLSSILWGPECCPRFWWHSVGLGNFADGATLLKPSAKKPSPLRRVSCMPVQTVWFCRAPLWEPWICFSALLLPSWNLNEELHSFILHWAHISRSWSCPRFSCHSFAFSVGSAVFLLYPLQTEKSLCLSLPSMLLPQSLGHLSLQWV